MKKLNRDFEKDLYIAQLEGMIEPFLRPQDDHLSVVENREEGTAQVQFKHALETLTDTDVYRETKRDPRVWKLVQMYWKKRAAGFIYTANFVLRDKDPKTSFQEKFISFLQQKKFSAPVVKKHKNHPGLSNGCLVLNKQDFHFNKADVYGNNRIFERLRNFESATVRLTEKAARNYNLEKIIYVIGSDSFNSEWTGTTTKGTPQANLMGYHEGFDLITSHEYKVIAELLAWSNTVEILFVPGNHDEYAGWHLVKLLEALFTNEPRVTFHTDKDYNKFFRYSNTAIRFHHGAEVKPQKLAHSFPVLFKEEWSYCDYWYIFCGDKHRPMEQDFSGIEFYGIPALNSSKSQWDARMDHHGTKAVYTAFVIEDGNGMADTYREYMQ